MGIGEAYEFEKTGRIEPERENPSKIQRTFSRTGCQLVFIQFYSADHKTVEAAGSVYHKEEELADGLWSVLRSGSNVEEIISVDNMPPHWREQLRHKGVLEEGLAKAFDGLGARDAGRIEADKVGQEQAEIVRVYDGVDIPKHDFDRIVAAIESNSFQIEAEEFVGPITLKNIQRVRTVFKLYMEKGIREDLGLRDIKIL